MDNKPKFFYILLEEDPLFYNYLYSFYSEDDIKIYWNNNFKPDVVKDFKPEKEISFYIIMKSGENNIFETIKNFLVKNPRIKHVISLSLSPPSFTSSFPILIVDRKFKNGVELKKDDYQIIIENFILIALYAEPQIINITTNFPYQNNNYSYPLCTFRVETDFFEKFISENKEIISKFLKNTEEITEEENDNFEINVLPEKRNFNETLPEILSEEVEDFLEIAEKKELIDEIVDKKIDELKELVLEKSLKGIVLEINEWQTLKKNYEEEKNSKKEILKEVIKKNFKIKYVRQKLEKIINNLSEEVKSQIDIKYFMSELKEYLLKTKENMKNKFLTLREEIIKLNEIKRKIKPYIKNPLKIAFILSLFLYFLKIRKSLPWLMGLKKTFFIFLIFSGIFIIFAFLIRWWRIKKQYRKCKEILEDMKILVNKESIKNQIETLSSKIIKKKFIVSEYGNIITAYQNLIFTLDEYTKILRDFSQLNYTFIPNSSLCYKIHTNFKIGENYNEKFNKAISELFENLWKFPDYQTLKLNLSQIFIEFLKEGIGNYNPEEKDLENMKEKFCNILNTKFYDLIPLEKNKHDRLDKNIQNGILLFGFPDIIELPSAFNSTIKIKTTYKHQILYFCMLKWRGDAI